MRRTFLVRSRNVDDAYAFALARRISFNRGLMDGSPFSPGPGSGTLLRCSNR